eukprot:4337758-Amphidinium_carterae.1
MHIQLHSPSLSHAASPTKSGNWVPTNCTRGPKRKVRCGAFKTVHALYKMLEESDIGVHEGTVTPSSLLHPEGNVFTISPITSSHMLMPLDG